MNRLKLFTASAENTENPRVSCSISLRAKSREEAEVFLRAFFKKYPVFKQHDRMYPAGWFLGWTVSAAFKGDTANCNVAWQQSNETITHRERFDL